MCRGMGEGRHPVGKIYMPAEIVSSVSLCVKYMVVQNRYEDRRSRRRREVKLSAKAEGAE